MKWLRSILADTVHLFYPHTCCGCGSDLLNEKSLLCLRCIHELPHTSEALYLGNHTENLFIGRLLIQAACSEFYFSKASIVQQLIHELKYKGNTDIGFYLGEMVGRNLLASGRFSNIDLLLPLPLHPAKERKRGYNQAAIICNGISSVMNIPVSTGNLVRQRFTETQTRKHRDDRWENVDGSFAILNEPALRGKHILLVDDVITTGATLEACGQCILNIAETRLSIAALAYVSK
jgi:ComF family protein